MPLSVISVIIQKDYYGLSEIPVRCLYLNTCASTPTSLVDYHPNRYCKNIARKVLRYRVAIQITFFIIRIHSIDIE